MKSDRYSKKIRVAIVITVFSIAPAALAIGEYLRDSLTQNANDVLKTEIELRQKDIECGE